MNVYFLLEGRRSEMILYPSWLKVLAPELQRVHRLSEVRENHYIAMSGEGFPSILGKHLTNAIRDIEKCGRFDYLVIAIDSDDEKLGNRRAIVESAVARCKIKLESARLQVIIQYRCLETWLLGNPELVPRKVKDNPLQRYIKHYDVSQDDPEQMPLIREFDHHSQFHYRYLKALFRANDLIYSKRNPGAAASQHYLKALTQRAQRSSKELRSLNYFLRAMNDLREPEFTKR